MWKLYVWDRNKHRRLLKQADNRQDVLAVMCSQTTISDLQSGGFTGWQLVQEWSGHVSSGY